ncbi:hypothetical protein EDD22DRAFT_384124 [Suillus occidentalis]|nr:hypothetical protein EDD22DRAFT_384124 [Suillus occidentalis]
MKKNRNEKKKPRVFEGEQYNSGVGPNRKEGLHATATNSSSTSERLLSPAKQIHKSTASPSAAMRSTNNDCVISQYNNILKTAAKIHTLMCGRTGCPVVFIDDVGTDWRTVSCLINDHSVVCNGGLYKLANAPCQSDAHSAQIALRASRLIPASWDTRSGNRDKAIADRSKQRKKEYQCKRARG